jgi:glycosyltransferase involved in cell wall biosynthesis
LMANDDLSDRLVISIGRITPAKDPLSFARIASLLQGTDFQFVWIGEGDAPDRRILEANGVHVTGWLTPEGVNLWIDRALATLVTSRWEGLPYSIVNSVWRGTPVVAFESCASLKEEGLEPLVSNEAEAALCLQRMAVDPALRARIWATQLEKLSLNGIQSDALAALYGNRVHELAPG